MGIYEDFLGDEDQLARFAEAYEGRHPPLDALWWLDHPESAGPSGAESPNTGFVELRTAAFARGASIDSERAFASRDAALAADRLLTLDAIEASEATVLEVDGIPANRPEEQIPDAPIRRSRSRPLLIAGAAIVAVVLVVVGVQTVLPTRNAVPDARGSQTASATASPTPTPTPIEISKTDVEIPAIPIEVDKSAKWSSPPVVAFGGDCNRVFNTDQVAGFLGVPKAHLASSDPWRSPASVFRAIIPHNGGVWCMWDDGTNQNDMTPGSHPWLIAVVLPASVLPASKTKVDCTVNDSCAFMAGANGYLIGGEIGLNDSESSTLNLTDVAKTAIDGITAAFPSSTANAGPPPAAYSPRTGDWTNQIDCGSLFTAGNVWKALRHGPYSVQTPSADGWPSEIDDTLVTGHGMTSCATGDSGEYTSVEVLPGGSWLKSVVAKTHGASRISIAGADIAYRANFSNEESNSTTVWAFSGSNLLTVSGSTSAMATAPTAGLLRALKAGRALSPVVTTAGYGDLKIGKPVPEGTSLVSWEDSNLDACDTAGGRWTSTDGTNTVIVRTANDRQAGKITSITILGPSVSTKSGVHVGMPRSRLTTLLPSVKPDRSGALYVVSDALGQVVFDVGDKAEGEYYPGPADSDIVLIISVLAKSATPVNGVGLISACG